MKKVNFIASLSPEKQYEIRRWFWITAAFFMCTMLLSGCFIAPQVVRYLSLKKEVAALQCSTKNYSDLTKNKDVVAKEYEELRVRENKVNAYAQHQKNPYNHITAIMQACGDGAKIEAVRFNKKDVELVILCPTHEHANVCVKRLNSSDIFSHVKMASLQYDAQTKLFRCVVKGHAIF